jgi:integrase
MARRVRDKDIETRAARAKLRSRGKPYYRAIGQGLHVGYRKGGTVGKWVVRRYVGDRNYVVETIATADDIADADGVNVLTFWQAQERAREIDGQKTHSGPYRVRDAIADYRKYLEGRSSGYEVGIRLEKHVLPHLGYELVGELTAEKIRQWHRDLSRSMPLIPKKRVGTLTRTVDLNDPEQARKRQVSANRVLSSLKAALNMAFREGKVASDVEWRRVAPFANVERCRNQYLTLAECERLLNVSDNDFRVLVRGALETGARYGELCRLRCGDFNPDAGTVHIRKSKSGKERHIILTEEGQAHFAHLTAGRPATAPMFGKEWGDSNQIRRMRTACARAKIEPAVGFHQLRHTWASHAIMAGMPLPVVARNLGHVDTKMVEAHYGHLAPSYVVDQVRKHAPRFGSVVSKVTAIR